MPPASSTSPVRNPENRTSIKRLTREHFALYRGYLDGVSVEQLHATYGDATTDVRSTRRLIGLLRDTLSGAARRTRDVEATHLLRLRPGSIPEAQRPPQAPRRRWRPIAKPSIQMGFIAKPNSRALSGRVCAGQRAGNRSACLPKRTSAPPSGRRARAHGSQSGSGAAARTPRRELAGAGARAAASARSDHHARRPPRIYRTPWSSLAYGCGAGRSESGAARHGLAFSTRRFTSPHAVETGGHAAPTLIRQRSELARPRQTGIVPIDALDVPRKWTDRRVQIGHDQTRLECRSSRIYRQSMRGSQPFSAVRIRPERTGARLNGCFSGRSTRRKKRSLRWIAPIARQYIETFLADPQPAAHWIGAAKVERTHPDWRPFIGALSQRSRETARAILHAMGEWLVDQKYLACNPFAACQAVPIGARIDVSRRSLSHSQWRDVIHATRRERYSQHELRDFLALNLAYSTGLRRSELANTTTGWLTRKSRRATADETWQLAVPGKGHAARPVPVPRAVMELVFASLRARGLPGDPAVCPPDTPLLAHFRSGNSLTPDGLGQIFHRLFSSTTPRSAVQSNADKRDFAQPSAHWIRHTHSHHALESGADCREVQLRLGHAQLSTTRLYVKAGSRARDLQR